MAKRAISLLVAVLFFAVSLIAARPVAAGLIEYSDTIVGSTGPIFNNEPGFRILFPGGTYTSAVPGPPPAMPPFISPSGDFAVAGMVTTSNTGPISYLFVVSVMDITGVQGTVDLRFSQIYSLVPGLFGGGGSTTYEMKGVFTDGPGSPAGKHFNRVDSFFDYTGDFLVARDWLEGLAFDLFAPPRIVPRPPDVIHNDMRFSFGIDAAAGDTITLPVIIDVSSVPEPGTLSLLGSALAVCWFCRRKLVRWARLM
jgi:hypothetical protein